MHESPEEHEHAISLVRDDLLFRLQRRIGLIPPNGLGIGRRAVFYALVTWLPIAVWAALARHTLPATAEPLLQHFSVHVRCLVAIPLFIVAEGLAHARTTLLLPYFVHSGLVEATNVPRLRDIVRGVTRLRDATLPWVTIAAAIIAWTAIANAERSHEVVWAVEGAAPGLGFGGWWFLYVARPVYLVFALGWAWRIVLMTVLFARLARLPLALVPTHPDRLGGLGFLERFPSAFVPVVLAASAVVASGWAHNELYHGVTVASLRAPMIAFVLFMLGLVLAPLLVFAPPLVAAKRQALLDYGTLVGAHGRLVGRRWIRHESIDDGGLLGAPEIGPVADTVTLYDAVQNMRALPLGKTSILAVAVPAAIPILVAIALQVPVKELLLTVLKALA